MHSPLFQISDLEPGEMHRTSYDVALFASGYEARSNYVASQIDGSRVRKPIVLCFTEHQDLFARRENDAYFRREWRHASHVSSSADSDSEIYEVLRSIGTPGTDFRMLVDYSSMSRLWYNAVLNWSRYMPGLSSLTIDFVYARGGYTSKHHPLVINDILFLPGCESAPQPDRGTCTVFSLGFDGAVALSAYDRLEPDYVLALYARPGSSLGDENKALEANRTLIAQHVSRLIPVPISSVTTSVWHIRELLAPELKSRNVLLVPLGPKPHVLASILVTRMHERDVGCLRVGGSRNPPVDVTATGELVVTSVRIDPSTGSGDAGNAFS